MDKLLKTFLGSAHDGSHFFSWQVHILHLPGGVTKSFTSRTGFNGASERRERLASPVKPRVTHVLHDHHFTGANEMRHFQSLTCPFFILIGTGEVVFIGTMPRQPNCRTPSLHLRLFNGTTGTLKQCGRAEVMTRSIIYR